MQVPGWLCLDMFNNRLLKSVIGRVTPWYEWWVWKEAVVIYFETLSQNFRSDTEENVKNEE
jgi:hypothetical protein